MSTAEGARVGKNALIYTVAFLLQRSASFVMLPIYTRYFSTSDYGVLQLLQTSIDVASIVFSAGITSGLHRFYFRTEDPAERRAVVVGSFWLLFGFNAIGAVALYATAPQLAQHLLEGEHQARLVRIAATSFMLDAFLSVPMLYLQAQQRAFQYATLSVVRLVFQLTLNILLVAVFDVGVEGILWSTVATHLVIGTGLTAWMLRETGFRLPRALLRELYRFGLPYRLTAAGAFVLTYGDRYFLEGYWNLDEVGIYSLAYQFGFVFISLGPTPFHLAWDPERFRMSSRPPEERNPFYAKGFFYFSLVVITLAVGISVFVRPLLTLMSDVSFHRAADLVPVVMAGFLCQAFGEVMDFGVQASGKVIYTTLSTWFAVAVILVLYLLLIPPLGGLGAALATIGGFAVRWVGYAWFSEKLFPIPYRPGRAFALFAAGAVVVAAVVLLNPGGFWSEVLVATAATGVFGCIAVAIMKPDERAEARRFLTRTARVPTLRQDT